MKLLKCRSPLAFVLVSTQLFSGCSSFFGDEGVFRSRQKDYLRAEPSSPLSMPDNKITRPMVTIYDVPEINASDEFGDAYALQDYEIPRPKPMADKGEVGVKIQKLGSERWIFLNASTSQVWPRTQNFMSEYNLQVVASNASVGLIETGWLRFKNDAETKTRYRVSLEKGIHPETSEIHILQMQRPESFPEDAAPQWPSKSDNTEREEWLLNELAGVLAESVDNKAASLLGQNVGGEEKVSFRAEESEPAMHLKLSNKRVWATVTHALSKEGFVLWDKNSDLGVFYVGYSEFGKKRGVIRRMAVWNDNYVAPEEGPYSLDEVLQHLSPDTGSLLELSGFSAGPPLRKAEGYLVLLNQDDDFGVNVFIRDYRGLPIPRSQAKALLRIIRKNLI